MYALPGDLDMNILSGCYLEMIGFGASITKLDFSRPQASPGEEAYRVAIVIEGPLSYVIKSKSGSRDFSNPTTSAPLLELLLSDVTAFEKTGTSSLKICFGMTGCISLDVNPDEEFESYTIYLNSGDVVAV